LLFDTVDIVVFSCGTRKHNNLYRIKQQENTTISTVSNSKKTQQSLPYQTARKHNNLYRVKSQNKQQSLPCQTAKNTPISTLSISKQTHQSLPCQTTKQTHQSLPCHGRYCGVFLLFVTVDIVVFFYGLTR
jgi:hypothetical protein